MINKGNLVVTALVAFGGLVGGLMLPVLISSGEHMEVEINNGQIMTLEKLPDGVSSEGSSVLVYPPGGGRYATWDKLSSPATGP